MTRRLSPSSATQYDKTKKVLSEHIDLLHRLAGVLFEREKLDADEFLDVMNGKLLPSAQTAAAGIIPAEAAAPETTELPTGSADGTGSEHERIIF